jgi:high-affinity Fe2+/Pb2+ permease
MRFFFSIVAVIAAAIALFLSIDSLSDEFLRFRFLFFFVAVIAAAIALYLSPLSLQERFFIVAVIAAAIALFLSLGSPRKRLAGEGGALGFGIISASCFVSSALLQRSSDHTTGSSQQQEGEIPYGR